MKKKIFPSAKYADGLRLNKRYGQYELTDPSVVEKIVSSLELCSGDTVLEIGPGTGVLTFLVKEKAGRVIAVEIDKRFCKFLSEKGVDAVNADFLSLNLKDFPAGIKIASNLPYYITTPIITKIIEEKMDFKIMVFTMQKEVAERMAARPGTKDYSAISVLVQYHTTPEIICPVHRKCFHPVPEVDSAVVRFLPREKTELPFPEKFLFKVVRAAFSSRRKMLRNNLKPFGDLEGIKIDLGRRAETLSIDEFCALAGELWKRR